jgi:hypothetical protein
LVQNLSEALGVSVDVEVDVDAITFERLDSATAVGDDGTKVTGCRESADNVRPCDTRNAQTVTDENDIRLEDLYQFASPFD